jgi:hypothetical protein
MDELIKADLYERWTPENAAGRSLEYLQFMRDLAQASIEEGRWPSLNPLWQQSIADLDGIIAQRRQAER